MQRILQAQSGLALLRGLLFPALGFVAGGIRHGMGFVEDDDAIKTCPGPRAGVAAEPVDEGILFTTYATLRTQAKGDKPRRVQQIIGRQEIRGCR